MMLWWTLRKLKSSTPQTRVAAIKDLAWNPDPRALDAVIPCLQDPDTDVVRGAVEVLSASQDARAQRALANGLESSNAKLRRTIAEALVKKSPDPRIFFKLMRLELSTKPEEHAWAIEFSSNLEDSISIQFVLSLLDEKDYYLRKGAAAAVARIGAPAVPQLLNRKDREQYDYGTSDALQQIRDPRALELLIKAVASRHPKYYAIPSALGEIGDPRGITCLVELFDSGEKGKEVVIALKKLGWNPRTDSEQAYVAAYSGDWNALVDLGSASTEGLLKILAPHYSAPPESYEVAGKVADERAIDQLLANLGEVLKDRKGEKIDGYYSESYKTRTGPSDPAKVKLIYNALVRVLERNLGNVSTATLVKISNLRDSLIVLMQEYASCRGRPDELLSESVAVDFSMARQLAKQELLRRT